MGSKLYSDIKWKAWSQSESFIRFSVENKISKNWSSLYWTQMVCSGGLRVFLWGVKNEKGRKAGIEQNTYSFEYIGFETFNNLIYSIRNSAKLSSCNINATLHRKVNEYTSDNVFNDLLNLKMVGCQVIEPWSWKLMIPSPSLSGDEDSPMKGIGCLPGEAKDDWPTVMEAETR